MRVFVTGVSGFVGSAIVKELLKAGHQVLGLVRTDNAAEQLASLGAEVYRGNLDDLESLKKGTENCDAVIHTAFNHDFSQFKANCEADRQIIQALGQGIIGSNRPLVITSGIGVLNSGQMLTEDDQPAGSETMPRAATEESTQALIAKGVNAYIVRLPPTVHGQGDHGFVPMVINAAKEKGESAYVGEGQNRWPAVHRFDAAVLYRLIIEQQPQQRVYHAVAEEGVAFKEIAVAIAEGLNLPTISKAGTDAESHFGWLTYFVAKSCEASSAQTRKTLGWEPKEVSLLDDLASGVYF